VGRGQVGKHGREKQQNEYVYKEVYLGSRERGAYFQFCYNSAGSKVWETQMGHPEWLHKIAPVKIVIRSIVRDTFLLNDARICKYTGGVTEKHRL
jgi:Zn-finger protein